MDDPILGGLAIIRPKPISYKYGDSLDIHCMSDLHIGAPYVDIKLIQEEIQEAVDCKKRVNINGDLFDAIVIGDKRYTGTTLHPRLLGRTEIMDEAIDWAYELLEPAARCDLIDMIGWGNHEDRVERWSGIDIIKLLVYRLEKEARPKKSNHCIHIGTTCGFIDYRFRHAEIHDAKRLVIFYHHGSGGAAPVTKGMIDFNRKDTWVSADIIWMGHKHNRWNAQLERYECPLTGDVTTPREVRHIMTGAYGNPYVGQSQESIRKYGKKENYISKEGFGPQGKGGADIRLKFVRPPERLKISVEQ